MKADTWAFLKQLREIEYNINKLHDVYGPRLLDQLANGSRDHREEFLDAMAESLAELNKGFEKLREFDRQL